MFSFPLADVYPVRDLSHAAALEPPVHLSGAVQWSDLAAVQAQLHNQRQVKITQHSYHLCVCVCVWGLYEHSFQLLS